MKKRKKLKNLTVNDDVPMDTVLHFGDKTITMGELIEKIRTGEIVVGPKLREYLRLGPLDN